MRVLVIRPEKGNVHPHNTEGWLYEIQNLVGGFCSYETPAQVQGMGIQFLANAEGVARNLPANANLAPFFYAGSVVAVGMDGLHYIGLTQNQIDFLKAWLEGLAK